MAVTALTLSLTMLIYYVFYALNLELQIHFEQNTKRIIMLNVLSIAVHLITLKMRALSHYNTTINELQSRYLIIW